MNTLKTNVLPQSPTTLLYIIRHV